MPKSEIPTPLEREKGKGKSAAKPLIDLTI